MLFVCEWYKFSKPILIPICKTIDRISALFLCAEFQFEMRCDSQRLKFTALMQFVDMFVVIVANQNMCGDLCDLSRRFMKSNSKRIFGDLLLQPTIFVWIFFFLKKSKTWLKNGNELTSQHTKCPKCMKFREFQWHKNYQWYQHSRTHSSKSAHFNKYFRYKTIEKLIAFSPS